LSDKEITVPSFTWVFHHSQLQRGITAWREKLINYGILEEDADVAINAILGFLASNEAIKNKMVMGQDI